MRIEKIVGQNVARRRGKLQWSQAELGRRVGEIIGKPWSRQTVSAAESGGRAFSVADLLVLSMSLEIPISALLLVHRGVKSVELAGQSVDPRDLGPASWQSESSIKTTEDMTRALADLTVGLRDLGDMAWDVEQVSQRLQATSGLLQLQQRFEASGADRPDDDLLPGRKKGQL